ncbi:MAG: single-stranded DNA-binding protein [Bacillota bacterium]
MNNVSLIGRLTREPELKYIPGSGTAVCNFTLAVDRGLSKSKKEELEQQGKPTADFIRIKVWGKQAENCANYCFKGQQVAVSGSIRTSTSKNDDGSTNYYTDVNAYRVEFLDYKNEDSNDKDDNNVSADDFKSVEEDDDIPF